MPGQPATKADVPPWGRYEPQGYRRFLQLLVRLGLSHGRVKRWLHRQWFSVGAREPVDIIRDGLKLRVFPWDNTVEVKLLFGSRARDREEMGFLTRHCPPGGVFLDIGANVGFYSLFMVSRGAGRVLAIEPLPTAHARMVFNVQANGFADRIKTVQAALGSERATVQITEMPGDLGGSSIVKTDLADGRSLDVPMLPLLDVLQENDVIQVDGMKIDVEGMEDRVLAPFFSAAPRKLWPRSVVIEHTHGRDWQEDILAVMEQAGYRPIQRNRSNALLRLAPAP